MVYRVNRDPVIDQNGVIQKIIDKVKTKEHTKQILEELKDQKPDKSNYDNPDQRWVLAP